MSDDNEKHPPASPVRPKSTAAAPVQAKILPHVTADELSVIDTESHGFDPYDTASLFIEKAAKNKE